MRIARTGRTRERTGAAAVEFAIVLPLLVFLLLGIWEVGRMVEAQQLLTNAAREGARAASTGARSLSEVEQIVERYLSAGGLNTTGLTVRVHNLTLYPSRGLSDPSDDPLAARQLDRIRVHVTLPFDNVRWVLVDKITKVTTLRATAFWLSMKDQPIVVDLELPRG
jgi:Flp pilus assembly protein TadG